MAASGLQRSLIVRIAGAPVVKRKVRAKNKSPSEEELPVYTPETFNSSTEQESEIYDHQRAVFEQLALRFIPAYGSLAKINALAARAFGTTALSRTGGVGGFETPRPTSIVSQHFASSESTNSTNPLESLTTNNQPEPRAISANALQAPEVSGAFESRISEETASTPSFLDRQKLETRQKTQWEEIPRAAPEPTENNLSETSDQVTPKFESSPLPIGADFTLGLAQALSQAVAPYFSIVGDQSGTSAFEGFTNRRRTPVSSQLARISVRSTQQGKLAVVDSTHPRRTGGQVTPDSHPASQFQSKFNALPGKISSESSIEYAQPDLKSNSEPLLLPSNSRLTHAAATEIANDERNLHINSIFGSAIESALGLGYNVEHEGGSTSYKTQGFRKNASYNSEYEGDSTRRDLSVYLQSSSGWSEIGSAISKTVGMSEIAISMGVVAPMVTDNEILRSDYPVRFPDSYHLSDISGLTKIVGSQISESRELLPSSKREEPSSDLTVGKEVLHIQASNITTPPQTTEPVFSNGSRTEELSRTFANKTIQTPRLVEDQTTITKRSVREESELSPASVRESESAIETLSESETQTAWNPEQMQAPVNQYRESLLLPLGRYTSTRIPSIASERHYTNSPLLSLLSVSTTFSHMMMSSLFGLQHSANAGFGKMLPSSSSTINVFESSERASSSIVSRYQGTGFEPVQSSINFPNSTSAIPRNGSVEASAISTNMYPSPLTDLKISDYSRRMYTPLAVILSKKLATLFLTNNLQFAKIPSLTPRVAPTTTESKYSESNVALTSRSIGAVSPNLETASREIPQEILNEESRRNTYFAQNSSEETTSSTVATASNLVYPTQLDIEQNSPIEQIGHSSLQENIFVETNSAHLPFTFGSTAEASWAALVSGIIFSQPIELASRLFSLFSNMNHPATQSPTASGTVFELEKTTISNYYQKFRSASIAPREALESYPNSPLRFEESGSEEQHSPASRTTFEESLLLAATLQSLYHSNKPENAVVNEQKNRLVMRMARPSLDLENSTPEVALRESTSEGLLTSERSANELGKATANEIFKLATAISSMTYSPVSLPMPSMKTEKRAPKRVVQEVMNQFLVPSTREESSQSKFEATQERAKDLEVKVEQTFPSSRSDVRVDTEEEELLKLRRQIEKILAEELRRYGFQV